MPPKRYSAPVSRPYPAASPPPPPPLITQYPTTTKPSASVAAHKEPTLEDTLAFLRLYDEKLGRTPGPDPFATAAAAAAPEPASTRLTFSWDDEDEPSPVPRPPPGASPVPPTHILVAKKPKKTVKFNPKPIVNAKMPPAAVVTP